MDDNAVIISARSQRQALDWSLVLASQDIETWIEGPGEAAAWGLRVAATDHARAVQAIEQFRSENRGWHWRRPVPGTALLFHCGSLFWGLYLASIYAINAAHDHALRTVGELDSAATRAGQWWRTFTAVSLHADLAHLSSNLVIGCVLLGLAMARYGVGGTLLAAYLAGVAGNLAGLGFYPRPYHGLGASGMVMGALGLLAVHSVADWRRSGPLTKPFWRGLLAGALLFVLLGLDPHTDVLAHTGGFIAGAVLGVLLGGGSEHRRPRPAADLTACGVTIGLMAWSWWRALR